ncbi:MAG TPA: hypothetical protein VN541_06040 [Tepidisphaeraceae bacterium]|nr:hypothetical protein [Tepidisphaeraceae bacterium]
MSILNWKYWHWMLASLAVGLAAVAIHNWSTGELSGAAVPVDLSSQQQRFETALLGNVEGHAMLRNISVWARSVLDADGNTRTVDVIEADYCTGEIEEHNGRRLYVWRRSRFVVPVPYRLKTALSDPAVAAAYAARIRNVGNPTVLNLLDAVRAVRKSGYSYAWWDARPWAVFGGGSVLLIGLVVPLLIRLSAVGRLAQPAAKDQTPRQEPAAAPSASLAIEPAPIAATREPEPVTPEHEFGMKKDDYYPTERAGRPER